MAFGGFSKSGDSSPMAEINMVPLIDVMLVLLVIFIITAPLLTHAVKIDLPKASSNPNLTRPDNIQLAIKANGALYWNGEAVDQRALAARMAAAAKLDPQPEVHLRADLTTEYQKVAEVMSAAAKAGMMKIGFVTEPSGAN
ncbi:MAG: biopolymer transporter ExbD [Betaproteobacteria bacterium]|nr:biopolymer transporter ExbD [Betaproteobacteria bacterium]